jgi:predicted branched-subunit amino acid permease
MNAKIEGTLAIIAAFIVLFSAMWDARVSAIVAIAALVAFGVYSFMQKGKPV